MQTTTFDKERERWLEGREIVIGVDEAGRGPLAGPVVACAAVVRSVHHDGLREKMWTLIRDSKTLSAKQRERAFEFIRARFIVGVGVCDHETIDRMNVLQATFLAMKRALTELRGIMKKEAVIMKENAMYLLIDGNQIIPNISIKQEAIIGGDGSVASIAAASIVAKVTRDRMMTAFHEKYPAYGFDRHKGYGTRAHMDALRAHGPCPIHRKSFGPVKRNARQG